jgi:hypothetical protein
MENVNEETVEGNWWETELKKETEYEDTELWKAPEGMTKINILGEPDFRITKDERDIAVFPIETNEKEKMSWILNRKHTAKAPYTQLLKVIDKNDGIGEDGLFVTVVVTGTGKNRQYTILDSKDV